jgi:glycerol-3-phosphate cytidylyltransferase
MKKYKRVITYGTFDLLHVGHVNLLRRAKELGDYLVVAVSADSFNTEKGKQAIYSEDERLAIVSSIRYVDQVILEKTWDQKRSDIAEYNIDLFVMGDDWFGKFDFLKDQSEVVYLPRTKNISTSEIKINIKG